MHSTHVLGLRNTECKQNKSQVTFNSENYYRLLLQMEVHSCLKSS